MLVGPKAYPVFILCRVRFLSAASSKSVHAIMPSQPLALSSVASIPAIFEIFLSPVPHALGDRLTLIPGAIVPGEYAYPVQHGFYLSAYGYGESPYPVFVLP